MPNLNNKDLKNLVLNSFSAEKNNDIVGNSKLLHDDFAVTDMMIGVNNDQFPRLSGQKLHDLINKAFKIKGREFIFKNVVTDENKQLVIVEFIESFPDPKTGNVYRTPQIAVCEVKDGKIYRTRHYMDPRLSFEFLSVEEVEKAFE